MPGGTLSDYDRLALEYGRNYQSVRYHSSASFTQRHRVILRQLSGLKNKKILDAGCGAGLYSQQLCLENTVIGLDLSMEMLRLAAAHALAPVQGDLRALPFPDHTFDGVLAAEVLQHFRDPARVVGEAFRVTRPGGQILFSSLNPVSILHRLYKPFGQYRDLYFHPVEAIRRSLENLGAGPSQVFMLAYPFGAFWQCKKEKSPAVSLATSWILTTCKTQK